MSPNNNRLYPTRNRLGNLGEDNRLPEDGASKDIPDLVLLNSGRSVSDVKMKEHTVPFGLFHIFFSLNSSTRASSGVMVAHLMPTLYF